MHFTIFIHKVDPCHSTSKPRSDEDRTLYVCVSLVFLLYIAKITRTSEHKRFFGFNILLLSLEAFHEMYYNGCRGLFPFSQKSTSEAFFTADILTSRRSTGVTNNINNGSVPFK